MFSSTLYQSFLTAALISPSFAKLYNSPSELNKTTYNYVVVGAGTAGNVVAARLTENPDISVLVVEAGISNEGVTASIVPLLGPSLTPHTIFDWNYTTTAQSGLNGRTIPYARGKLLGGSSSVNFMVFNRGSSEDFDRFAAVTQDSGWSWNNMQRYIQKNERLVAPADRHNTTGEFVPSLHGFNGSLEDSLHGDPTPLDSRIIATTQELPAEFPFNPDMIGGNVLGIGWTFSSIGSSKRSSSATAYLAPALSRPNLDVVLNAQAIKLLRTGTVEERPSFHSVQVAQKEGGPVTTLHASNEIVLSAGTFGTAALLQLSGIGNKADLQAVGVATIVNNPSVGKNMSDHAFVPNVFAVNSTQTYDGIFRSAAAFNATFAQWAQNGTGPFVNGVCNHLGWLRLPSNASIFQTVPDPTAGPNSSHFEMIFSNLWVVPGVPSPPTGNFFSISTTITSPTSRGSVTISSSNAFVNPVINPNWLTTAFDIFAMVEAVKTAKRFVSADAWKGFVIGAFGALANAITDAEIQQYVRDNGATVYHATGTASMSPKGAKWGVVDPDLKVKGVEGLRIVDGSVLPYSPSAHTQGPIYLIAERAADLIRGDFSSPHRD